MTAAIILPLLLVSQDLVTDTQLLKGCITDGCRVGDTGHLATHFHTVRGEWIDDAATVKQILDKDEAVMVNHYAVSKRETRHFEFIIKGMNTIGWVRGEVRQVPHELRVTAWRILAGRDLQVIEPITKKP